MNEEFNTKFYFYVRVNGVCSIYSLKELCELKIGDYQTQLPGNFVTVCVITNYKGDTARGLSVLSINDSFVLEVGMNDAECKALRAIKGRKLEKEYSDERAVRVLIGVRCPYTFPAERNPNLSLFERRILFGKKYKERVKDEEITIKLKFAIDKSRESIKALSKAFDYGVGVANRDIECGEIIRNADLVTRTSTKLMPDNLPNNGKWVTI